MLENVFHECSRRQITLVFRKTKCDLGGCAIKVLEGASDDLYDWSTDLMSIEWDSKQAISAIASKPERQVCDVLMDQDIFSGLGNIMKNEILFNRRLHPETAILRLSRKEIGALVKESKNSRHRFYEWKAGVLKKNWLIFRKKKCPVCAKSVTKRPTGIGKRMSHFCPRCQAKVSNT